MWDGGRLAATGAYSAVVSATDSLTTVEAVRPGAERSRGADDCGWSRSGYCASRVSEPARVALGRAKDAAHRLAIKRAGLPGRA